MRILYLTHTCPYPPNRGDRIRCYHILRHLAKTHQLRLVYPLFTPDHYECQSPLLEFCEAVFPVEHNHWLSYFHCFTGLFSHRPLSVSYFYSKKLANTLQTIDADVIISDCSSMAPYVMGIPIPKILDFVDIDSQKWNLFSAMSHFPYSWIYSIESNRLANFEYFLSKHFDYCLVTSLHEKSLLSDASNIMVLRNGVDRQYFSTQPAPAGSTIIFTGVMNYFPNTDAAMHFHRHVFPLIKRDVPAAQFIVAGMHPTPQIRKLTNDDTEITGFVPDIRQYLARASVCVVPLRLAMGVQNKILEAMAMGVPVVATSVANRGINATPGQEILVADDPQSFATATVSLLQDASLREKIAKNAQEFVEEHFCWEKNMNELDALIAQIIN